MKFNKWTLLCLLLLLSVFIAILPLVIKKDAEFSGSDDAGSQMVHEIEGDTFKPWFTPVIESALGRTLPGEVESLLFCLQTGIGVGVIAFGFGYLVARKRYDTGYNVSDKNDNV